MTREKQMARQKAALSIGALEKMLQQAQTKAKALQQEREKLATRIEKIDDELASLGVQGKPVKRKKPVKRVTKKKAKPAKKKPGRKKMTLAEHVSKILAAAKKPISPKDMAAALKKKGVSKSEGLANQIGMVLVRGKVAAKKVGRGLYVAGKGK